MKKFFLSLIAMAMTMCAMAQMPQFNPEDMAKRQAESIKQTCNLNDEQYKSVLDLFTKNTKQMMAEMDSIQKAGGNMMQGFDMEKMRKRNEDQNKALKAILTEEQFKAYEKMQEERRQRFANGGGFGGGFGGNR